MDYETHPTRIKENLKYTGWIKDKRDDRDYTPNHPAVKDVFDRLKAVELPASVDLRSKCSPIKDQGNLGSCTANAAASNVEFIELKQSQSYKDASRLFIYYVTRQLIEKTSGDTGAEIRDTIKTLATYGSCLEKDWQYIESKFDVRPSDDLFIEALNYQSLTYVSLSSVNDIKTSLANGIPVQTGFLVFNSFDYIGSDGIMPMPNVSTENLEGGHAVLIVGYTTINGTEYFIIQNSWGKNWGKDGFFYMPIKYFSKKYQGNYCVDDCWSILTQEYLTGGGGDKNPIGEALEYAKLALSSIKTTKKNTYIRKVIEKLEESG